jgi:hypothetical protein
MLFDLRITIPDRPGALGAVATALSHGKANIVTLDVVEHGDGVAVDHLCVDAPGGLIDALKRVALEVPEATIEAVRPVEAFRDTLAPIELAAALASAEGDALRVFVREAPGALWTTWCLAYRDAGDGVEIIASSACSPQIPVLSAPWLPLRRATRLDSGDWMPPAWRMGRFTYEVAGAPLPGTNLGVLVARRHGPRFRPSETRALGLLADVAAAGIQAPRTNR